MVIQSCLWLETMAYYEKSASPLDPIPHQIKKEQDSPVYTMATPYRQGSGPTTHQHSPSDMMTGLANIGSRRHDCNTPVENIQEEVMMRPSSPTQTCNLMKEDMSKISHTLVELSITEQDAAKYSQFVTNEIICAVASKVLLMTTQETHLLTPGGTLNVDLTCYWCNFCPFKSENKELLIQHIVEHRFVCKFCPYQSFSRSDVIRHAFKQHSKVKETTETLKFCIILPDYLHAGNKSKRKLSGSVEETEVCKKKKLGETCSFDVEVDEIDDGGKLAAIHGEKILVPFGHKTINEHVTSASVSVIPRINVGSQSRVFVDAAAQTDNVHPSNFIKQPAVTDGPVATIQESIPRVAITTNQEYNSSTEMMAKSSELCWKCGHCEYTTMEKAILKIHIQQVHVGEPLSYVALQASTPENMNQFVPAGMTYSSQQSTSITPPATLFPVETVDGPEVVIENVESDKVKDVLPTSPAVEINITKEMASKEQLNTGAASFKCAHCNCANTYQFYVKDHLLQKHSGSVIYALDMKAVKLKQPQYIFFCHKKKCYFSTKSTEAYSVHVNACTPWLEKGANFNDIDEDSKRSLILTLQFAKKVEGKSSEIIKTFTSMKTPHYGCAYCSYISSNNTRLKKHVLSNHFEMDTIMKAVQAGEAEQTNELVYFCKHCLWETRDAKNVKPHLVDRHKELDAKDVTPPASIVSGTEKDANQITIGVPAIKIIKKKKDPVEGKEKEKIEVKNPVVKLHAVGRHKEDAKVVTQPASIVSGAEKDANQKTIGVPAIKKKKKDPVDWKTMTKMKQRWPSKAKTIITGELSEDEDLDSESAEEEEGGNLYPNIEDKVLQEAISEYIASKYVTTSSRTLRKASEKAKIVMSINRRYPSLFTCGHCDKLCFGAERIRMHIKNHHKSLGMIATQMGKKNADNTKKYICPKEKCDVCNTRVDQIIAHAKKQHGYRNSASEIVNIKAQLTN